MKFWKGVLLLHILTIHGPSMLNGQSGESPATKQGLQCYTCLSHNSWEHCDERAYVSPCEAEGESCLKIKVDRYENNNGSRRVLTHYAKYCSADCSDKQCIEMGWRCQIDCCNHDRCNTSNVILASIVLVAIVLCLTAYNSFVL